MYGMLMYHIDGYFTTWSTENKLCDVNETYFYFNNFKCLQTFDLTSNH